MKNRPSLLLGISILLTLTLFAQNPVDEGLKTTGTKPVDEGQKIIHQEDTTKGSNDLNNTREYKAISLSTIKKSLVVKRKDINHAPFTCLHYNSVTKKFITIDEQKSGNSIDFSIEKTKLKENDRIFVVNNVDSTKKNRPMGKDVIIEIEILK